MAYRCICQLKGLKQGNGTPWTHCSSLLSIHQSHEWNDLLTPTTWFMCYTGKIVRSQRQHEGAHQIPFPILATALSIYPLKQRKWWNQIGLWLVALNPHVWRSIYSTWRSFDIEIGEWNEQMIHLLSVFCVLCCRTNILPSPWSFLNSWKFIKCII